MDLNKVEKSSIYVGTDNNSITPLLSNGKWDKDTLFFIKDLRTIEFDTDYINSLKLLEKDNKKLLKAKGSG